jgi:hypothetical protein
MDREIYTLIYHKRKWLLQPKAAVEVMFLEYDAYCICNGGPISIINEMMYLWNR